MKLPSIFKVFMLAMLFFMALASTVKEADAQTSVNISQAYPGAYTSSAISFNVLFSSDSLLTAKTKLINIAGFDIGTISWKATGTLANFRINAYKTNFNSSDTAYWTLVNQWDTTGNYTGKPVIDTVDNALITNSKGLPMRYLAFLVKGLAGNREDVELEVTLFYHRKNAAS